MATSRPSRQSHPKPPNTTISTTDRRRTRTSRAAIAWATEHGVTLPVYPFPLSPHQTQWAKRHLGRTHYFGLLSDPEAAYRCYLRDWPRILRGQPRIAIAADVGGVTLLQLVNAYLDAQTAHIRTGNLRPITLAKTKRQLRLLLRTLGAQRPVESLDAVDFDRLASAFLSRSIHTRITLVSAVHALFRWAAEPRNGGFRIPDYGDTFTLPREHARRAARHAARKPPPDPAAIRALLWPDPGLPHPPPMLRAALLLAINGGCTQADMSCVRFAELVPSDDSTPDDPRWEISTIRSKTAASRRIALWPETVAAILEARCSDPANPLLLFRPRGRGVRCPGGPVWMLSPKGTGRCDWCTAALRRHQAVLEAAGAAVAPVSFLALRKAFSTVASSVADDAARRITMGHTDAANKLDEHYVQRFPIERLRRTTGAVHAWLHGRAVDHHTLERSAADTAEELRRLREAVTLLVAQRDGGQPPLPTLEPAAAEAKTRKK